MKKILLSIAFLAAFVSSLTGQKFIGSVSDVAPDSNQYMVVAVIINPTTGADSLRWARFKPSTLKTWILGDADGGGVPQVLSINGRQLTISGGNTIEIAYPHFDSLIGAPTIDTSFTNELQALSIDSTASSYTISLQSGGSVTFQKGGEGGGGTDDQTLSWLSPFLSIEGGNSVDLSGLLDNTDDQSISIDSTATTYTITLENGGEITFLKGSESAGTDDQAISIDSTSTTYTISLEDGGSVTFQKPTAATGGSSLDIQGWEQAKGTYTEGSPLSIAAGDSTAVMFEGARISAYLPGVSDSLITFDSLIGAIDEGDIYLMRLDFLADNNNLSGKAEIQIDIGGGQGNIVRRQISFANITGEIPFSTTTLLYSLGTFVANGGTVRIKSITGITTIWDVNIVLYRAFDGDEGIVGGGSGAPNLTIDSTASSYTISVEGGNSITFEKTTGLPWASITGKPAGFDDGVDNVDDGDNNSSNELQTLSINGQDLTISSGNTVTLPSGGGGSPTDTVNYLYPNRDSLINETTVLDDGTLVTLYSGAQYRVQSSPVANYTADDIAVLSLAGGKYGVLQGNDLDWFDLVDGGAATDTLQARINFDRLQSAWNYSLIRGFKQFKIDKEYWIWPGYVDANASLRTDIAGATTDEFRVYGGGALKVPYGFTANIYFESPSSIEKALIAVNDEFYFTLDNVDIEGNPYYNQFEDNAVHLTANNTIKFLPTDSMRAGYLNTLVPGEYIYISSGNECLAHGAVIQTVNTGDSTVTFSPDYASPCASVGDTTDAATTFYRKVIEEDTIREYGNTWFFKQKKLGGIGVKGTGNIETPIEDIRGEIIIKDSRITDWSEGITLTDWVYPVEIDNVYLKTHNTAISGFTSSIPAHSIRIFDTVIDTAAMFSKGSIGNTSDANSFGHGLYIDPSYIIDARNLKINHVRGGLAFRHNQSTEAGKVYQYAQNRLYNVNFRGGNSILSALAPTVVAASKIEGTVDAGFPPNIFRDSEIGAIGTSMQESIPYIDGYGFADSMRVIVDACIISERININYLKNDTLRPVYLDVINTRFQGLGSGGVVRTNSAAGKVVLINNTVDGDDDFLFNVGAESYLDTIIIRDNTVKYRLFETSAANWAYFVSIEGNNSILNNGSGAYNNNDEYAPFSQVKYQIGPYDRSDFPNLDRPNYGNWGLIDFRYDQERKGTIPYEPRNFFTTITSDIPDVLLVNPAKASVLLDDDNLQAAFIGNGPADLQTNYFLSKDNPKIRVVSDSVTVTVYKSSGADTTSNLIVSDSSDFVLYKGEVIELINTWEFIGGVSTQEVDTLTMDLTKYWQTGTVTNGLTVENIEPYSITLKRLSDNATFTETGPGVIIGDNDTDNFTFFIDYLTGRWTYVSKDKNNPTDDFEITYNYRVNPTHTFGWKINRANTDTDNQTLSINGNDLTIQNGNTVTLPSGGSTAWGDLTGVPAGFADDVDDVDDADANATNEIQTLSLATDNLSLSNGGGSVDLSPYSQSLSLSVNTLSISGENNVDLSGYVNTDAQTLSIDGSDLTISGGNTVTLPGSGSNAWGDLTGVPAGFADNIDNVDDADASTTNEIQTLQEVTDQGASTTDAITVGGLIVNGGFSMPGVTFDNAPDTVLLINSSGFVRKGLRRDYQNISLSTNTLSIDNGNSVDLSGYVNDGVATSGQFDGANNEIDITSTGGNFSIPLQEIQDSINALVPLVKTGAFGDATNITIDLENKFFGTLYIDMTAKANNTVTFNLPTNPKNGGQYMFYLINPTNETINFNANIQAEDQSATFALSGAVTSPEMIVCTYSSSDSKFYCQQ